VSEHAWPSISKLSLNWMSVPTTIFFSSVLRWMSGSFRTSRPFRYSRSNATRTMFFDDPLSSFCSTEKSVLPSTAGTTTSPSMTADAALICHASCATFLKRRVQSCPRRVNIRTASFARWTCTRYPSNLIS
jgi:hypothetical protein